VRGKLSVGITFLGRQVAGGDKENDLALAKGMASVNVNLPAELVSVARLDQGDVSKEAAKFIALELFREGTVSLVRAAELCETPLAAFMDFAAAHGVPPLNYVWNSSTRTAVPLLSSACDGSFRFFAMFSQCGSPPVSHPHSSALVPE